jgi:phosphohistidine phosphatase SixA
MSLIQKMLLIVTLVVFSTALRAADTAVTSLIKDLQSGGHIIYMRHGPTTRDQKDSLEKSFDDCRTQRNLSESGRKMVSAIGQAAENLQIPIGQVFSSPYCRCKDTAQLAFKRFIVEQDLQFSMSKDKKESKALGERLKTMMLETPSNTHNTIFVGHTSNLREGLGVWPKPEGVWTVFKKVNNEILYKGMIKPDQWPAD